MKSPLILSSSDKTRYIMIHLLYISTHSHMVKFYTICFTDLYQIMNCIKPESVNPSNKRKKGYFFNFFLNL